MKPEDFFYSKQQLERYRYAAKLASRLIGMQNDGYLIFDEEMDIVKGKMFLRTDFSDDPWDVFSINDDGCTMIIIGIEYWDDGRPWITTKKNIKELLSNYFAVYPKNIKRVV